MINRLLFIVVVCLSLAESTFGQPEEIGGIVNLYTPVVDIGNACANNVTVEDAAGYGVGDRVLIIQMKGAELDQNNNANFGSITAINEAGNFEFGNVLSINGNDISLVNNLMNAYSVGGLVQLIRVPQYVNATVTSPLSALPWNGAVGGVLVVEVSQDLTLQAPINTNGAGFRGGNVSTNFYQPGLCASNDYFFDTNQALGAEKGEGISIIPADMMTGRGSLANGGGGGNNLNAGGGGGANGSSGGVGGNEWSGCTSFANGGLGGSPILYPSKVFLGGGGGGGHQNNSDATPGSNGGGIIILKANTLISNGFEISNNGNDILLEAGIDAGGGAGAGGTTLLDITNYVGTLAVSANGGQGGSVNNNFTGGGTGAQCHGPGGGGGGGLIGVTDITFPGSVIPSLFGGDPGLVVNPQSACEGDSYGASSGVAGPIQTNIVLNESTDEATSSVVDLGPDQSICLGQTIILDPGLGVTGIWQDGSEQETYTVLLPGIYTVMIEGACGAQMDEIVITESESIELNLPPEYEVCDGNSVQIGITDNPEFEYEWIGGANTSEISVNEPGVYTLTATLVGTSCTSEASTTVSIIDSPLLMLNGTTQFCEGNSATLIADGDPGDYSWNTGVDGNILEVTLPGTYTVTLTNAQGCISSGSVTVTSLNQPEVIIEGPSFICDDETVIISAVGDAGELLWEDGSVQVQRTISEAGVYSVSLTNSAGCSALSTIQISFLQAPIIQVDDVDFCIGTTLELTVQSPNGNVSWPGLSSSASAAIGQEGDYEVVATNSCGITEQMISVIAVDCSCDAFIPNAFTPDGDGLNDLFAPRISCDPDNYSMLIFDRWGQLIFESTELDDKWNGSSTKNGSYYAKAGLYVYIVEYDNPFYPLEEKVILRGSVFLIR